MIQNIYFRTVFILEKCFMPILTLLIRLWMAKIFWYSGLTKISDWQTTIALFEDVYKVPFISSQIAAYVTVSSELICPILLSLGFAARFAAIPLIIITAVIQFSFLYKVEHFYWMLLFSILLCYGPGFFSVDYLIRKRFSH